MNTPEEQKKRHNSFGDAAAVARHPGMQHVPAPAPQAPGLGFSPELAARYQNQAAQAKPPATAPEGAPRASQHNQIAPGIYQHGRGQFSDNPEGMGIGPLLTRPAAAPATPGNGISSGADAAQRVAEIYKGAAAGQAGLGFSPELAARYQHQTMGAAPVALHSGNSWEARNHLRNLEIGADSLMNERGFITPGRQGQQQPTAAQQAYADAVKADMQARGMQAGLDQEAMRQRAGFGVAGLKEQATNQRAALETGLGISVLKSRMQNQQAQQGMEAARLALDERKLGVQQQALANQAQNRPAGAQLPHQALRMQQEELDALGTAAGINADLGAITGQLDRGDLKLGPIRNMWNRGRNALGLSTPESRNLASFDASLEKLRNDSLRLNKGVQTEGDAQRAMNEVMRSTGDQGMVRQRLDEVQRINQRAADLRAANVDQIRQNYGAPPLDTQAHRGQPPALGQSAAPATATPPPSSHVLRIASANDWQRLPAGAVYRAADGSIRRKRARNGGVK